MSLGIHRDDFIFEYRKRAQQFECFCCKLISPKNYFIQCKHCICQNCLYTKNKTRCPYDGNEIIVEDRYSTAFQFIIIDKLLNPFLMYCIFKGCDWAGKYQEFIEKHYKECKFRNDECLLDEYFSEFKSKRDKKKIKPISEKKKTMINKRENKRDNYLSTRNIFLDENEEENLDEENEEEELEEENQSNIKSGKEEKFLFLDNNKEENEDENQQNKENSNIIYLSSDDDYEHEEYEENDEDNNLNKISNKINKYNNLIIDKKNSINIAFINDKKEGHSEKEEVVVEEIDDFNNFEYIKSMYPLNRKRKRSKEISIYNN